MAEPWVVTFQVHGPITHIHGWLCQGVRVVQFYRGSETECRRIVKSYCFVGSDDRLPTRWHEGLAGPEKDWLTWCQQMRVE
jgi:hypothetical protein